MTVQMEEIRSTFLQDHSAFAPNSALLNAGELLPSVF